MTQQAVAHAGNSTDVIGGGAGLFADMGVGKTLIACALIVTFEFPNTLVVGPKSVVKTNVWGKEFKKHAPGKVKVVCLSPVSERHRRGFEPSELSSVTGAGGTRAAMDLIQQEVREQAVDGRQRVFVVNYQLVWRNLPGPRDEHGNITELPGLAVMLTRMADRGDLPCCVLDESHRIKAPGGRASMFLGTLGRRIPYRLCLTGTPMPQQPTDVYSQYRFLDPGIFGTSFRRFKDRYTVEDSAGYGGVERYCHEDEMAERMYSIAYRVMSDDVLDLPPTQDIVRNFELSREGMRYYNALNQAMVVAVADGRVTATNALVRLMRMQQITSGFLPLDEDTGEIDQESLDAFAAAGVRVAATNRTIVTVDNGKRELLKEILEDLPANYAHRPAVFEPTVIFCRFRRDIAEIKKVSAELGRRCAELSGARDESGQWADGEYDDMVVQIQAGGEGLDFTRARYCIFYSLGFSLGQYEQARKRVHRPGQTRNTTYIHLVAENTADEQVYEALRTRQQVISFYMNWLTAQRPAGLSS